MRRPDVNPDYDWSNPGFEQADDEPVVCVSLEHATAYTQWLSGKTGKNYYIPSEAQWEYAAKAGTSGRYFWGEDDAVACDYANVNFRAIEGDPNWTLPCDDGYDGLAPVGSFLPNAFGMHDPIGNAWEWVTDCSHKNYNGAPADGSAWIDEENCLFRIIRGGGAGNDLARTTNVVRAGRPKTGTAPNLGFRAARAVGQGAAVQQAAATYEATQATTAWPVNSEAGKLFAENCAACHQDASSYKGVYGTDFATISRIIKEGGNNIMSMPAFGDQLSDAQIGALATYLREQKGWD
jgi:mono/diheme cytochrome c family protein